MVIINTSATEVSIHAVSPELGVQFSRILPPQAGGAGASSANAMVLNRRQSSAPPNRTVAKGAILCRAYVHDPMVCLLVARDVVDGYPASLSIPSWRTRTVRSKREPANSRPLIC